MSKRRHLKYKLAVPLNESGVGGVLGAAGGLAVFEGAAHMGTAGLVWAAVIAIVGGLNGKLVADGGKFVAERMLVNPPAALVQTTFGGKVEEIRGNSEETREKSEAINLGTEKRSRQDFARTMYQLKGILVLGLPGMGKTVTVSTIATQLVERGAHLSIIDIKGQLDDSLTGLLAPFEAAFATPPAHTPQLMLETAEYADSVLDDRLSKRTTNNYPYYLIIDEFTDLMLSLKAKDRYTEAANKIAEVVKRINILGRSLNIYCFAVGQITTAETTGGTAIRETFNTRILHGMSEYEAGIVEKNGGKKTISQLGVGEAYVTVGGIKSEPQVVRIKQISDQEKRRIAGGIVPFGKDKETRVLPEVELPDFVTCEDTPKETRQLPEEEMVVIGRNNKTKEEEVIPQATIDFLIGLKDMGRGLSIKDIQKLISCSEQHAKNIYKIVNGGTYETD